MGNIINEMAIALSKIYCLAVVFGLCFIQEDAIKYADTVIGSIRNSERRINLCGLSRTSRESIINTGKQDTGKQDTGKQDTGKQDTGVNETDRERECIRWSDYEVGSAKRTRDGTREKSNWMVKVSKATEVDNPYLPDTCECGINCKCPPHVCETKNCKKNYVVMFSATWCGPCKKAYPIMEELKKEGYIVFIYKLDLEEYVNLNLNTKFDIHAYPTFIIFEDGKEIKRAIGVQTRGWFKTNLKLEIDQSTDPKPVDIDYDL